MNLGTAKKWCVLMLESPIQTHCLCDDEMIYSPTGLLEKLVGEPYHYDSFFQCYANTENSHLRVTKDTLKKSKAKTDLLFVDDIANSKYWPLPDEFDEETIEQFSFVQLRPNSRQLFVATWIACNYKEL